MSEPNLLTHELLKLLGEYLKPGLQPEGAAAILEQALAPLGKDLSTARVADYRRLYHEGWKPLLDSLVPAGDQQWLTDRFKALMF